MSDDISVQRDEISALSAIFGDEFVCEDVENGVYSIELKGESSDKFIRLSLKLPKDYPSKTPPSYEISAPWMPRKLKSEMVASLDEIYEENHGESIIYVWIEKAKEYLFKETSDDQEEDNDTKQEFDFNAYAGKKIQQPQSEPLIDILHGDPVTDRRSAFQAHAARVTSIEEVNRVVDTLKSNKKIATATHNIVAYRIITPPNDLLLQDCDDDGETHAGSRLLHLLQILDVTNVVVVVSRWFGGIQLGPDRFKHINNVARDILDKSGFISSSRKSNKKSK